MYRLLDLRTCKNQVRITPEVPTAVVDSENVLIAAVSKSGHLIYHNRAFMKAHQLHCTRSGGLNIQEALPNLWQRLSTARREHRDEHFKVIDLFSDVSHIAVGHLLVSFQKSCRDQGEIDFQAMLSQEEHPLFIDSYIGFYVADPQAFTVKVNPAYEKIAFLPESDLVGRNLRELEEKGYFSQSVTLRVLEKLKRGETDDVTLFQKIITGQEAMVTGKPIFSEGGGLTHILTFVRNILPLDNIALKFREFEGRPKSFPVAPGSIRPGPGKPNVAGDSIDFVAPAFPCLPVIARDPLSVSILRQAIHAAQYDSPVLLCGETGVGKDILAQYIHKVRSQKRELPFVAVNASAIPQDLLESELFGYEEGAFSGARRGGKPGLFEEAHGGTLFLNEISEMPLNLQAKLLSALDEGCVRRLGGSKTKRVKVRIVCATNRDLRRSVDEGAFRSDLYYRIKVLTITVPPVRERPRDILPLVHHFMAQLTREHGITRYLSADVQDILLAYSWPGNIRELRNAIERMVVFSTTEQISVGDLPVEILDIATTDLKDDDPEPEYGLTLKEAVRRYERRLIEHALKRYGRVPAAASALGIDPTTLIRKLKNVP
jgi:transcriptional regulator with PAS, ATPase and Fis domain